MNKQNLNFDDAPEWAVDIREHEISGLYWTDGEIQSSMEINQKPLEGCGPRTDVPICGYEAQYNSLFGEPLITR